MIQVQAEKFPRSRGFWRLGSDEFEAETAGSGLDWRASARLSLLPSSAVRIAPGLQTCSARQGTVPTTEGAAVARIARRRSGHESRRGRDPLLENLCEWIPELKSDRSAEVKAFRE